jgi:hypothetical protein
MNEGRYEALAEIETRAEAVKSAAFDGPPTPASRRAEGSLSVWRAAYEAAYRELLVIEEWDRSLERGGGLLPSINKHPFERVREHASYLKHEAYMADPDAKFPERLKREPERWWEKDDLLDLATGWQKPNDGPEV